MVAGGRKGEKKQRKYYKELTAAILNDEYHVHIFLGDAERAYRVLKKLYPDIDSFESFRSSRGYFSSLDGVQSIWVGLEPDDPRFYATLSHEAVHAIDDIFNAIQEKNAPEIYAHSVAAVVAKVEQWVKKQVVRS